MPEKDRYTLQYVYYRQEDWESKGLAKYKNLLITDQDIQQAYIEAGQRLRGNLLNGGFSQSEFDAIMVNDIQHFLNLPPKAAYNSLDETFQELMGDFIKEVNSITRKKVVGNININAAYFAGDEKFKSIVDSAEKVNEALGNFKAIYDEFKKINDKLIEVGGADYDIFTLTSKDAAASFSALQSLKNIKEAVKGKSVSEQAAMIRSLCGNLRSNLIGGFSEVLRAVLLRAQATAEETITSSVIKDANVTITKKIQTTGTSGQISAFGRTYAPKSDNRVAVRMTGEGLNVNIEFGISEKATKYSNKAHILSDMYWEALFVAVQLLDTPTEYLIMNMEEHGTKDQAELYLSYLAAKTADIAFAGVGGFSNQAAFIRFQNKIFYLPDYLESMGKRKRSRRLKATLSQPKNEPVGDPENNPNIQDAYSRSRNIVAKFRRSMVDMRL